MENLNELEIAKAYVGTPCIIEKVKKIAIGTQTGAIVYSRRIFRSQGALIGITDEIFYKWWDEGKHIAVYIGIDDETYTIEDCRIQVSKDGYREDGKHYFIKIAPTQQELEIFQNIMDFITTN